MLLDQIGLFRLGDQVGTDDLEEIEAFVPTHRPRIRGFPLGAMRTTDVRGNPAWKEPVEFGHESRIRVVDGDLTQEVAVRMHDA